MNGWTVDDVLALTPEYYAALLEMVNEEAKPKPDDDL